MNKWLKYTLWAVGIVAVLIAGEQLFDFIRYRTKTVYISANSIRKEYHIYENCPRLNGQKVFKVKLREAHNNNFHLCKECEVNYDLEQRAK